MHLTASWPKISYVKNIVDLDLVLGHGPDATRWASAIYFCYFCKEQLCFPILLYALSFPDLCRSVGKEIWRDTGIFFFSFLYRDVRNAMLLECKLLGWQIPFSCSSVLACLLPGTDHQYKNQRTAVNSILRIVHVLFKPVYFSLSVLMPWFVLMKTSKNRKNLAYS